MHASLRKWSSITRFILLAIVFAAFLSTPVTAPAQATPPSRPILFVHGFCGSAYDWAPLLASLLANLPNSEFTDSNNQINKTVYIVEYNSVTNGYTFYQASDQYGNLISPFVVGSQNIVSPQNILPTARIFAIQFYDPLSNGTDADNVTRISVLNKAYEVKKVIEKIKEITNPTNDATKASSVNVVAHSMGGLDTRVYVENLASQGSCYNYQDNSYDPSYPSYGSHPNYPASTCLPGSAAATYANDVANIITIDTPHWGSPLAEDNLGFLQIANLFGSTAECQAFNSTNKIELLLSSDGGPGLLEELNYQGSPNFGVAPSKNSVPIQAIQDYFTDTQNNLSWTLIYGNSDDVVTEFSQLHPNLSDDDNSAPLTNTSFEYLSANPNITNNPDCKIQLVAGYGPMLHSMKCLGALTQVETEVAAQLERDNELWINSWSITPSMVSLNAPVTIGYSAVDLGSTTLSRVRLYRAPDNNNQPGAWALIPIDPVSGSTYASGSFTDTTINGTGIYWYIADVLDSAGREARAPIPVQVQIGVASATTYTLTIHSSNPSSGVGITASPVDNNGSGSGTTSFVLTYNPNTQVTLTAPATAGGNNFSSWTGCGQAVGVTCTVTMTAAKVVSANYAGSAIAYTLTVDSLNPSSGAVIAVSPADNSGAGNGTTSFVRTYNQNTQVTLTAPAIGGGNSFSSWTGCDQASSITCTVTMTVGRTVSANYTSLPITGEWVWMGGSNTAGAGNVYGTLGVPSTANVLGARSNAIPWVDSSGNFWLFGGCTSGCGYGGSNDLWEYNQTTNVWTWMSGNVPAVYGTLGVPAAANVPSGRWGSPSWVDSSGKLWFFGGYGYYYNAGDSSFYFNDLWNYNPATKQWTWVSGSAGAVNGAGIPGTQGVPAAGNTPGNRMGAVGWTQSSGNLWLFGGFGCDRANCYYPFGDLWNYSASSNEWTWEEGAEAGDAVYGTQGTSAVANNPGSRYNSVNWTDSSGNFWLFGGTGWGTTYPGGTLSDLWKYNPTTNLWTWVRGPNTVNQGGVSGTQGIAAAGNLPGARSSATSWTDGSGNFWLFGGIGYDSTGTWAYLNDLWNFNPTSQEWTWVSGYSKVPANGSIPGVYGSKGVPAAANVPGSRIGAVSWVDKSGNLWLFGGLGNDAFGTNGGGAYLNDLWEFKPYAGTAPRQSPLGSLDAAFDTATGSTTVPITDSILIAGWAADPSDGSPLSNVTVYIDGKSIGNPTLGVSRTDVAAAYNNPAYLYSGYQMTYPASSLSAGAHTISVIATNSANLSTTMRLATITITRQPPLGSLDAAFDINTGSTTVPTTDSILIAGWAADPVDGSPLSNVTVYIDGNSIGNPTLGVSRPDVALAFSNSAYLHSGYQTTYPASSLSTGSHTISVTATNSASLSTTMRLATITVTRPPPLGSLDAAFDSNSGSTAVPTTDSILIAGWAADPVDGSPLSNVVVYIDGNSIGKPTLGISRPDVAAAYSNSGYLHSGYQMIYPASSLSAGSHTISVIATNSANLSTTMRLATITVTRPPPLGTLDAAFDINTGSTSIPTTDSILIAGWAADPVDGSPLSNVLVYIDGNSIGKPTLNISRPDVAGVFSNSAYLHSGYQMTYPASSLSAGSHTISVIATNSANLSTSSRVATITVH